MKRKIILVLLGILIVMLGVLRISYAFIKDKVSESAISNVEIKTCAKLQLIEDSNSINLENTYPMEDSMGLETKPYEFTISSTCEVSVGFSIYITSISESTINESYIKYAIKDERGEVVEENIIGKSEDGSKDYNEEEIKELEIGIKGKVKKIYKIYSDRVTYSVDKKYYLYLWIDSQATEETVPMGSIYKAGITIKTDNGSEKQPFIIKTIEDIVNLSNSVNKGTSYENEYIVLSKDLDFRNPDDYEDSLRTDYGDINGNGNDTEGLLLELTTGSGFVPIGSSMNNAFKGNFDGSNKTIDNLHINNNTFGRVIGFFGDIKDSTISNLIVRGEIVSDVRSVRSGVIGRATGTNKVNNITNYVNVSSTQNEWEVSGIVGANFDTLEISNVKNYGKLNGGRNIGGIIGYNKGTITIKNAENYGEITSTIAVVFGGIIGDSENIIDDNNYNGILNMENVHNYGKITNEYNGDAENYTGGIIAFSSGTLTISNSHNEGEINHNRINYNNFIYSDIGGLVGKISSTSNNLSENKILNSYNSGNIFGGTYVGGIIGLNSGNTKTIINKIYNSGTVDNHNLTFVSQKVSVETGGIVGCSLNSNNYIYIINSYNIGEINGKDGTGGLVALSRVFGNNAIINSYNIGKISSKVTNYDSANGSNGIGSFAKDNSSSSTLFINNVYHYGTTNNLHVININGSINYQISKLYYNEELIATNYGISNPAIYMRQQAFVDELNKNVDAIDLKTIDSSLEGYKLCKWKLGENNYPELIFE